MLSASQTDDDRLVAEQIHRYLLKHPQAEDTIDGIVQWWLLKEKLVTARAAVQRALNRLVSEGLLLKRRGEDGAVYFRLSSPA